MATPVKPKTEAKEAFLDLLGKNRLMPNLVIEREAQLLLSRVNLSLLMSKFCENSMNRVTGIINPIGPIECTVPFGFFRELSPPDNRRLLLAALALKVEEVGGDPNKVDLTKRPPMFPFLGNAFDKAVIQFPSADVAIQLCRPFSDKAETLRQRAGHTKSLQL